MTPSQRARGGAGILLRAGFLLLCAAAPAGCAAGHQAAPPCPVEASVHPGINDPYRGEVAVADWVERFENEGRELYARREAIVAAVGPRPGQEVADVGAGTGVFTLLLARAVGPTGRVVAVDIVPEFLELIRRRAAEQGLENVETLLGGEREAGLRPASVDLVFVCDTYHHFEYPRSMLASLRAALRPGGELVVVDFKRIPNLSSEWIMEHVRAGEETVADEITAAGFALVERRDFLDSNYFLRFRKED